MDGKYLAYSDELGFTVKSGKPANATAANPITSYESYVLGLDPADEHSKPFLAAIQTEVTDGIVLTLGGIKPRLGVGATISCAVEYADNLGFTGSSQAEPAIIGKIEGNTFTVPLPICENDSAVRFFRARIKVE